METAFDGKVSLKERLQEFKEFGKVHSYSPNAMPQTECSTSKGCEKSHNNHLEKSDVSASKTSISACSCGPECGPNKCDGRNRSVLVGWDSLRTKIFITLFVLFMVWLVIYVPISLTLFNN